jgi:hypothetical protein
MSTRPPREKLTFSQAHDLEPLPKPLTLGEVSQPLRNAIYSNLYLHIDGSAATDVIGDRRLGSPWIRLLLTRHVHVLHEPADEFNTEFEWNVQSLKNLCFNAEYNELFDLLELLMKLGGCPRSFTDAITRDFERYGAAYRVIQPGPVIVPIASPEEGQVVQRAFQDLAAGEFDGARAHLRQAGVFLGKPGEERHSIRESISAVEAVCRILSGDKNADLRKALGSLKGKQPMHKALGDALEKLYGYTSDEKGVRHSLLEAEATVDATDAQFMFGACAAFVSYLIGKSRIGPVIGGVP